MAKFGWDKPEGSSESVLEWLRASRESGGSGGFRNLGFISRDRASGMLGRWQRHSSRLPRLFTGASASIFSLSPSLSGLVFLFELAEDEKDQLQRIATKPVFAQAKPKGRSVSLLYPSHLKDRALRKARTQIQEQITSWLEAEVGGVISSSGDAVPCIEFLQIRSKPPYMESDPARFIGLNEYDCWREHDAEGWRFTERLQSSKRPPKYASIVASEASIAAIDLEMYGGRDDSALATDLNFSVTPLAALWGTTVLLRSLHEKVSAIRDGQWQPISASSSKIGKNLVQRRWRLEIDAKGIASELLDEELILTRSEALALYRSHPFDPAKMLVQQNLYERIQIYSKNLVKIVNFVSSTQRELDASYATLQSVVMNRRIGWLTAASVFVAVVAALVALASLLVTWLVAPDDRQRAAIRLLEHLF